MAQAKVCRQKRLAAARATGKPSARVCSRQQLTDSLFHVIPQGIFEVDSFDKEIGTGSFYVDFACVDAEVVRLPSSVRVAAVGMIFHLIDCGVGRMDIFEEEPAYIAFERILEETVEVRPPRVCSDCLMPNHWHVAQWPEHDGDRAAFLQRLTVGRFRVHGGGWIWSKKLSSHDGYCLGGEDDSITVYANSHNAAAG